MAAALPANETERLKALRHYGVLYTAPEQSFDDLAQVTGFLCQTPVVAVSLVDEDRQWFKAKVGCDLVDTPREHAFCAHTILGTEPFVVPDASNDERFADNPYVIDGPRIRFYAGAPLLTPEGYALGALCVIDVKPRPGLCEGQLHGLTVLARQVMTQLELRRVTRESLKAASASTLKDGKVTICSWCRTVSEREGDWNSFEQFIKRRLDVRVSHGMCPSCFAAHSKGIDPQ